MFNFIFTFDTVQVSPCWSPLELTERRGKRDWMKESEGISQRTCMRDTQTQTTAWDGQREWGEGRAG